MRLDRWFNKAVFCVLGLAGLVLIGACSSRTIQVKVAAPLTGDQAKGGNDVVNGAQLAVDDWNAKGGVLGKKIVMETGDDKGEPDQALILAKEWTGKADVIIGHYNSSCTLAAEEVYGKDHDLMITPSSTNPDVTDRGYLTIFRVCGRDDQQGKSAAQYIAATYPTAKVAVIHDKSSYGQDLANEFLKNFEFTTKSQAAFYGSIDRSHVEFSDVVNKVKAAEPTVIYFGGLWPQGAELLKEIRKAGITATFVSGDGCYDPEFINKAGKDVAEGTLVTFIPDQETIPTAKTVVEAYKKRYGDLGPYSLYAYTAVTVALQGMQKAGSRDGIDVAKALHKMEVETPFGTMKFDEKGDPQQSPYVMWKVVGGKFVEVPAHSEAPAQTEEPAEAGAK
jgi:branched-chain amino acid transport system substrate-binding protein